MLFFTDYGIQAKLERCNMDGTNRTRLVDYKVERPTAVALDLVKKLVYWADAYLDYIEMVDYNGKNRHTIIQGYQVSSCYFFWHCGLSFYSFMLYCLKIWGWRFCYIFFYVLERSLLCSPRLCLFDQEKSINSNVMKCYNWKRLFSVIF